MNQALATYQELADSDHTSLCDPLYQATIASSSGVCANRYPLPNIITCWVLAAELGRVVPRLTITGPQKSIIIRACDKRYAGSPHALQAVAAARRLHPPLNLPSGDPIIGIASMFDKIRTFEDLQGELSGETRAVQRQLIYLNYIHPISNLRRQILALAAINDIDLAAHGFIF